MRERFAELRREGELIAAHDGVASHGIVLGKIVAEVSATAFAAAERGGDDDGSDAVEIARFDGTAGEADGHGAGERGEDALHGFETGGIAEESGVFPHIAAEVGG